MAKRGLDGGVAPQGAGAFRGPSETIRSLGQVLIVEPYGGPIALADDRNVWERQPGETDRMWNHFQTFRDLNPEVRTLIMVWRQALISAGRATPNSDITTPPPWISMTAGQYRWKERAQAYDMYLDKQTLLALQRQQIRAKVETADLGRTLRLKAAEAARVLQTMTTQTVVRDGQTYTVTRSALAPGAIATLAKVGASLERMALGMEDGSGAGGPAAISVSASIHLGPLEDDAIIDRAASILEARQQLIEVEAQPVKSGRLSEGTPSV